MLVRIDQSREEVFAREVDAFCAAELIRLEAADIRKTGRSAQGVRLIKTDATDKVTSASLVEAAAEEELEETT